MSFRPDSPIELPNGQLVCGAHGHVICSYCTVDYSFMEIEDDELEQDDEEESRQDD
jgi:ribonuclease HI